MASHRKGTTGRDYAAEYQQRKQRGLARGLSIRQLRGHGPEKQQVTDLRKAGLIGPSGKTETLLRKKYAAVARMGRGESLSQAAMAEGIAPSTLRRFLKERQLAPSSLRSGGGDRMPVLAVTGYFPQVPVDKPTSRLLGRYWRDVFTALAADDAPLLRQYEHTTIYTLDGRALLLETDLDAIRAWYAALVSVADFWRLFVSEGGLSAYAA